VDAPNDTVAIVTTLRNAGAVIDSFVAYHRAIGFQHLFLFFDDPADPNLEPARKMPDVTAIPHDAALRETWRTLPGYRYHERFIDSEVMSRQILNLEYAIALARKRKLDWLLSIDADELFFSPNENVRGHFAALSATPSETVSYPNYEAVPEVEAIDDFFREVDLFKVPWARQHLAEALGRAQQTTPQLRPFFHFYSNGKPAVRLTPNAPAPNGLHEFRRATGETIVGQSSGQCVLHYACCGFDAFWTKYTTLGHFADRWWDRLDIAAAIGPFHLEARNVVMKGGREQALAFYRERLAITDAKLADKLIEVGILTRLSRPRTIIARAMAAQGAERDSRAAALHTGAFIGSSEARARATGDILVEKEMAEAEEQSRRNSKV